MSSEMVVSINHHNRISMVINHHKPDITVNTTPSIEKDQALNIARQSAETDVEKDHFQPKVDLMVYEDSVNVFHLIWKVILYPSDEAAEWLVIVDAHSGQILEKHNMVFDYVTGSGKAFNPDPGTALRDVTLPDSNDIDYEELQPAYNNVSLYDLNNAVSGIYKVQGRYAWSENIVDLAGDDEVVTASDPGDFVYNRSQNGFEEVNIYYFIDKQRRYLGTFGFSPTWIYIDPNGSDAIAYDARGETGANAHYYPSSEYMTFGVPSAYADAGEDQCLPLHEYGHALHDALINGGTDSRNAATSGISEGIADYMAISYRRTTQADPYRPNYRSNWLAPSAGTCIRTPENAKYPTHWTASAYEKMKVWASTMMDMEYNTATDPTQGTNLGRDTTTVLMLTSLSYVTSYSSIQDNVQAFLQADRDIPEYNGEHIQELAIIFDNRGFFYDNKVSGTISSNTTWENFVWITGDVTVNSGVTLTIEEGTYLFFEDNTQLIINGTLDAQGTSSGWIVFNSANENPATGDWDGIRFNNSSVDADCIIDYCDIRNADFGVYCYYSKPTIQNSNFEDNTRALYLFNADNIVIKGCQLIDNSYGIYSGYTDNISIKNNIIQDCYYYGVYLYRSSATIMENSIENTSYYDGINVASYSDIDMNHVYAHPNIEINNSIIDNHRYGIYIASSASADLGVKLYMQPPYLRGGFNFFEHDSGIYDAYNASSNTVRAELNWWDNMALSGSFDTYPTAIDQGYQLPKSTSSEIQQLIAEAYRLEVVDSVYADAINLLNRAIAVDPSDPVNYKILLSLVRLYNKMDDADGLLHYLDQLFYEYSDKLIGKIALDYSVSIFLNRRDFKEALERSDQVISIWSLEKGANELIAWALYEQGQIIQEMEKQSGDLAKSTGKSSVDIFAMIPENYPESEAAEAIGLMDIEIEPEAEKTAVIPRKFALKSAYPNPFNPKTTISFDLPEEARVEIVVYDLIGREIWKSTRTSYPAGTHSLVWNGTTKSGQPVGTGVYLVRLNSPKYSATQKVLLIK